MKTLATKSVLSTIAIMVIAFSANAQSSYLTPVLNAVNTNIHYGDMNGELQSDKKGTRGLQAGLSMQAGISDRWSLLTEVYFVTKGGTLKTGNVLTEERSTLRLREIELPTLARVHFGKFYLNAGPYSAYLLSGKIKSSGEESGKIRFSGAKGYRHWELGFQAGAGYAFNLKKSMLAIDFRYGHGLTSLSEQSERYNRMLNISVLIYKPWKKNLF